MSQVSGALCRIDPIVTVSEWQRPKFTELWVFTAKVATLLSDFFLETLDACRNLIARGDGPRILRA